MTDTSSGSLVHQLDRLFSGDLADDEVRAVQTRVASDPALQVIAESLRQSATGDIEGNDSAVARGEQRLSALLASHTPVARRQSNQRASRHSRGLWAIVALFVVVAMGGLIIGRTGGSVTTQARVYAAQAGHPTSVTLPDGSVAMLAPHSTLQVPSEFGHDTRTVHLRGEAYFNVPSARGTPFLVHTGSVTTRVLGTRFSVRRYRPDDAVQVTVLAGKVATSTRGQPVRISAGHTALVTDSTATVMSANDLHAYTDWTRGRLVFEDANVSAMLETLGQWYGYTFALADSALGRQHVSVVFKTTDRKETMMMLSEILDVSMTMHGNQVTLTPRREAARDVGKVRELFKPSMTERGR